MGSEMGSRSRRATEGRRRRRTASGVQLSADRIVDAATNLLERRGAEALSARKLGEALGADPTALYRYFVSMDDVVLAVADRLIGQATTGFIPGADWRTTLRDLACRVHAVYVAHPHVAQVAFCRVTRRPHEMAFVETVLTILMEAGFSTAEAVARYRALADTMLSFAGQDAGAAVLPLEILDGDHRAWRDSYREQPAHKYPHITQARELLAEQMTISSFGTALDFLLLGFGEPTSAPSTPTSAARRRQRLPPR